MVAILCFLTAEPFYILFILYCLHTTKANESFDNGVFFDIEAKRTPSIVSKLFSKRNEHIR
jgi:hypothetical protein